MSLDVSLYVEVDTGGKEPFTVSLFSANITHNLGNMASEAGIYTQLWRPEEAGYKYAGDIVDAVESGLKWMKSDSGHFKQWDATNGWGLYKHFVPWIEKYLQACKDHPKSIISVSR